MVCALKPEIVTRCACKWLTALCFRAMLPTVFGSHAGNYEIMDHAVRCVRMVDCLVFYGNVADCFGSRAGNCEITDHAVRCVRMVALPRVFMAMPPTMQLCRFIPVLW